MYERIVTRIGIPLEIVMDYGLQFTSDVWENLIKRLAIEHMFTTMYKPWIYGLVERTKETLCFIIAKETETKVNASIWVLKNSSCYVSIQLNFQNGYRIFSISFSLWCWGFASEKLQTYNLSHCYENTVGFEWTQ